MCGMLNKELESRSGAQLRAKLSRADPAPTAYTATSSPLHQQLMCVGYAWSRWDDDVVFKNQSRNEPKKERRFINDTIRNDFHRR